MKVVYCAYGAPKYAKQLLQSVRSLRAWHPQARILLYTTPAFAATVRDLPVEVVLLDRVAKDTTWHDPKMKLEAIHAVARQGEPFLYLDNDTYVAGSLQEAWALLADFDCLGVPSPIPDQRGFLGLPPIGTPPNPQVFPEWNGGVLFFAGTRGAQRIADLWLEWVRKDIAGGGDQWSLAQALWAARARLHALPNTYNCRLPASPCVYGALRILHDDHPDLATVASVLNADLGYRQVMAQGNGYRLRRDPAAGRRCF